MSDISALLVSIKERCSTLSDLGQQHVAECKALADGCAELNAKGQSTFTFVAAGGKRIEASSASLCLRMVPRILRSFGTGNRLEGATAAPPAAPMAPRFCAR